MNSETNRDTVPSVVGIRLGRNCRIYNFNAGEIELSKGNWVIVETARGQDAGQVVQPPREIARGKIKGELKNVIRQATPSDMHRMERFRKREQESLARAKEKVAELGLPMRLITAEYTYNGRSLTIYFTAEKRVDFRDLVRKLARSLRTRIELRQVGARDEARLLGGIGPCGRILCCETFLTNFQRISVRMAKEQNLPLSPIKISGVCGRLLCCLNYEYEQYREIKALLPRKGEQVVTLHGRGTVVGLCVPKESVTVEVRPGLKVEANIEELAEAARLDAEGRLPTARPSYAERISIQPTPDRPAPEKKKRRRRRRKKSSRAPQPAGATAGKAPAKRRQSSRRSASAKGEQPSSQRSRPQRGQQRSRPRNLRYQGRWQRIPPRVRALAATGTSGGSPRPS